ncbi:MAG: TssN family type VI secretion system protein [Parabacteroides sp.]|nr:TssN family type VI secretion system protein [Parabacteroides sp.]
MNPFLQTLTITYLIYPILGLLLVGLGIFIAKKNALLNNKRLIGYTIGAIVALTLPALFGFLDYDFMPYGYMSLAMLYLILGWYNIKLINWVFREEYKYRHEIILTLFIQLVAMLFFTLVFNLCNDLQYGLWASTSMLAFAFVSLFVRAYDLYLEIPEPIYKLWKFADSESVDMYADIDFGRLKVVTLEIYKEDGDHKPLRLKGKVPDDIPFGVWIKRLIEDYNKKYPLAPIRYETDGTADNWMFYRHTSAFLPKRHIDCSLTVKDNRIHENCFIVAKRIKEYIIN